MEQKHKRISIVLALLNLLGAILFFFIETENNLYWSLAFGFNALLLLLNTKRVINITALFALCFYYMYWAMMHIPKSELLTEEGKRIEMIVATMAFFAFLSIGWMYFVNRKRW